LSANRLHDALHTLKRVRMVLKTIVGESIFWNDDADVVREFSNA
jgi:hypothetical protein